MTKELSVKAPAHINTWLICVDDEQVERLSHGAVMAKSSMISRSIFHSDRFRHIDEAVAEAYGWTDLVLEHDFHEVDYLPKDDRIRFTTSGKSRIGILRRLAQLNKERYEEEVRQGLHGVKATARPKCVPRRAAPSPNINLLFPVNESPCTSESQAYLHLSAEIRVTYGTGSSSNPRDEDHARAISAFLEAYPGWHPKSAILAGTCVPPSR